MSWASGARSAPVPRWYIDCALRFQALTAALALLAGAGAAARAQKVVAVDIDAIVHPITVEIVGRAIEQAKQENAAIVLVRLDTPGGLADAMREIIQEIVASPVPVVAYVTPSGGRAASAGFFILEAADVAAMAPATNTGASTPVAMFGEMDPAMAHKVQNDAAALLRSVATAAAQTGARGDGRSPRPGVLAAARASGARALRAGAGRSDEVCHGELRSWGANRLVRGVDSAERSR